AAYAKAPGVTRDRMYVDTMQQIFSSTTKVMIDSRANNNMLYLPLDKLMQQVAANDAQVGSKSGPVQVPGTGQPAEVTQALEAVRQRDERSRDSSRDRETR
ncbi:MAG: protease modulator HflK, partial [Oxalobacteraceae bacterium]